MSIPGITSIMVPLDGSDAAVRAVAVAARMAIFRRARLHLVGVFRPASPIGNGMAAVPAPNEFFRNDLRAHLESVAHDVSVFHRVRPEPVLLEGTGSVASQLLDFAALHGIDLAVLRTHGRTGIGRLLLGSVADGLINEGLPCLLLRDHDARGATREAELPGIFRRVLVPLDGSSDARSAIDLALSVATPAVTEIRLVLVVPPRDLPQPGAPEAVRSAARNVALQDYLEAEAARIEEHGVRARGFTIIEPSAANGILTCVDAQRIDLVTIGSHHRTEAGRLFFGSVMDELIRKSEVPVLATRANGAQTVREWTWSAKEREGTTGSALGLDACGVVSSAVPLSHAPASSLLRGLRSVQLMPG
jgi:nucleotide-binding universal stress UspA family protein